MSHLEINYLIKAVYIWIYASKNGQKIKWTIQGLAYFKIKVTMSGIFQGDS